MTKQQKYEKCRSLITTACPDLMELTFGCEVLYQGKLGKIWKVREDWENKTGRKDKIECDIFGSLFPEELDKNGILGREPRLADIIRALGTKIGVECFLQSDGKILIQDMNVEFRAYGYWPSTDRLSDCSEECLDFIIGILEK